MNKNLIIIILLLATCSLNAQEYRKYWADGDLTWNDFQAKTQKTYASKLAYILSYKTDKKTINNTTYYGVFSDAYIDKSLSFVHLNIKDAYHLKYNQVLFNLLELKKRELQKRIYDLDNYFNINSLYSDSLNQLEQTIANFQEEGNYGIIKDVTDKWLEKTNKELAETAAFTLPDFRKSNWTYGLYAGLDFGMYGDTYKELFNHTIGINLGFEFSYKKIFMGLNMGITNSKLNNNLVDPSLIISAGKRSSIGILNAYFGYPVYETNKFRVIPFVGYGVNFLSEVSEDNNRQEINTGTSLFGVNIDFKGKKKVYFTPSIFNVKEEGYSYFRARFFINNSNFNSNLKGYTINIGLSYGIEGRFLSKK